MIKLLIGGSPCTYWSICQKNGRETTAEGMGWELFKNYLIAREKFKPDFFLYENNKSADEAIKMQIRHEFGVTDPFQPDFFTPETGVRYIEINSALVSAQNRERFYVHNCGEVGQPKDRGILLKDILENGEGIPNPQKSTTIQTSVGRPDLEHSLAKMQYPMAAKRVGEMPDPNGNPSDAQANRIYSIDGKTVTANAGGGGGGAKTGLYAVPVNTTEDGNKARTIKRGYHRAGLANFITNGGYASTAVAEKCASIPINATHDGKSQTIRQRGQCSAMNAISQAGTSFGASGVAQPVNLEGEWMQKRIEQTVKNEGAIPPMFNPYNECEVADKAPTQTASCASSSSSAACMIPTKAKATMKDRVYKVENGMVEIKGKQYPIKLEDGYYMFRPLTVKEVSRLQTMPDDYCRAVSKSAAYRCLGNGWTAQVIIHILSHALGKVPRDEEIVVLSMYDGIATGRYCLDKMGFTNVRYYAYEIDKYAMQVALSNYPDIIECGDAFQLRDENWRLPE